MQRSSEVLRDTPQGLNPPFHHSAMTAPRPVNVVKTVRMLIKLVSIMDIFNSLSETGLNILVGTLRIVD